MEKQIATYVDEHKEELFSLLQALIHIKTTNPYSGDAEPGGERGGQEYLRPIIEAMGGQIDMFDCPDDIYAQTDVVGPANRDFHNRPNLVATWDFGGDGPTIIINGHMDTVGIDTFCGDALSGSMDDERIYGRGTSDCKGGIATGVAAIQALLASGAALRGKLIFESVVDEECNGSGAGTLACLQAGYTGDMAVFVDGKDDTITVGCNGCLTAAVDVKGEAGHAARGTGVNAIEKAVLIQQAIYDFKRAREAERPGARLNLGIFRGGIHPAVVPAEARLEMNIVYELDEAQASREATGVWGASLLREEFTKFIREAEAKDEWLSANPSRITWIKDLVPFDEGVDTDLVRSMYATFESVAGYEPGVDRMVAWADACWPSALAGIPTILYGPASHTAPHTDDEYAELSALVRCTQVLAVFLVRNMT